MVEKLRITMLGNTRAGKTAFLTAMYGVFSAGISPPNDTNEFSINSGDSYKEQLSTLYDRWEQLLDTGIMPAPTMDRGNVYNALLDPYEFILTCNNEPLIKFDWVDYRGGALTDPTSEDAEALLETGTDSDCLILCISAEHLKTPLINEDGTLNRVAKLKLNRRDAIPIDPINNFFVKIQEKHQSRNSNARIPLVIMITKADLLMPPDDSINSVGQEYYKDRSIREKEDVIRDIQALFPVLFKDGSKWLTMICPFTIGSNVVVDFRDHQINDKLLTYLDTVISGDIDPRNAETPICFAIYGYLLNKRKKNIQTIGSHESSVQQIQKELEENKKNLEKKLRNLQTLENKNFFSKLFIQGEIKEVKEEISDVEKQAKSLLTNKSNFYEKVERERKEQKEVEIKLGLITKLIEGMPIFNGNQRFER